MKRAKPQPAYVGIDYDQEPEDMLVEAGDLCDVLFAAVIGFPALCGMNDQLLNGLQCAIGDIQARIRAAEKKLSSGRGGAA